MCSVLNILNERGISVRYSSGEDIFHEDDSAAEAFYVVSGKTERFVIEAESGMQVRSCLVSAGGFLGLEEALGQCRRESSARAFGGCHVIKIGAEDLRFLLRPGNVVGDAMLNSLARTNLSLLAWGRLVSFGTSEQKLAHAVLSSFGGGADELTLRPSPTQREFADMIGTSKRSVARILGRWEEGGVVERRRRELRVLSLGALQALGDHSSER